MSPSSPLALATVSAAVPLSGSGVADENTFSSDGTALIPSSAGLALANETPDTGAAAVAAATPDPVPDNAALAAAVTSSGISTGAWIWIILLILLLIAVVSFSLYRSNRKNRTS